MHSLRLQVLFPETEDVIAEVIGTARLSYLYTRIKDYEVKYYDPEFEKAIPDLSLVQLSELYITQQVEEKAIHNKTSDLFLKTDLTELCKLLRSKLFPYLKGYSGCVTRNECKVNDVAIASHSSIEGTLSELFESFNSETKIFIQYININISVDASSLLNWLTCYILRRGGRVPNFVL